MIYQQFKYDESVIDGDTYIECLKSQGWEVPNAADIPVGLLPYPGFYDAYKNDIVTIVMMRDDKKEI